MKSNNRLLALVLALLLGTSVMFSCASDTAEENSSGTNAAAGEAAADAAAEETVPEETEPELAMDDLADADFGGAEYIIAGLSNRTTNAVTSAELDGEVINDAQYNSARTVEDRFNAAISYVDLADADDTMATAVKNLVASGDDTYGVTFGVDTQQINLGTSGNYLNLKSVSQFNFDQPWWIDSTESISIGDKSYVASSYLSYYCLYYMRMFVINKDMAKNYGLEIPYDAVYEGNWYLDDLVEMCAAATSDTNGDGQMTADDQYGLSYEIFYTLQNSMGIDIIKKDADNMPYLAFDVDRATIYLEKMEPIVNNYGFYETGYGATMFSNGQSLFCYCNLREVCNVIRDSEINYGYLPAPKLDEHQEDYMTCATDVYWGIPVSSAGKADMIGTITEALSCQHFNYVRPAFYETTMKTKLAGDENDMKMLDLASERLKIDFGFAYQTAISAFANLDDLVRDNVTAGTVASTYQKNQKVLQKSLEKIIEKVEKLP